MTALHELDAHAMADALARGETTSLELVEHHLGRIDDHGAALGAFVTVTHERALQGARDADATRRAASPEALPPFLGVLTR